MGLTRTSSFLFPRDPGLELRRYQRQALAWMIKREELVDDETRKSMHLNPGETKALATDHPEVGDVSDGG
jgi:hypothetical protein